MIERIRIDSPANPGANGTATLYDDVNVSSTEGTNKARVKLTLFADQVVTVKVEWSDAAAGTLRQVSSTATTANTLYDQTIRLKPGRNKITIITTTAPTVWQVAAETVSSPVTDA